MVEELIAMEEFVARRRNDPTTADALTGWWAVIPDDAANPAGQCECRYGLTPAMFAVRHFPQPQGHCALLLPAGSRVAQAERRET